MKFQNQIEEYGITKDIYRRLNKHQQIIFKNSWNTLKAKTVFNKVKRDLDFKELITIFYDNKWNVIYNEKKLLEKTPFTKKVKE